MAENIGHHHMSVAINGAADTIDVLVAALEKASQLADVAINWHLEEVAIDGEMVSTRSLQVEIDAALALARESKVDA